MENKELKNFGGRKTKQTKSNKSKINETVNEICKECVNDCKQSNKVELIQCLKYKSIIKS